MERVLPIPHDMIVACDFCGRTIPQDEDFVATIISHVADKVEFSPKCKNCEEQERRN